MKRIDWDSVLERAAAIVADYSTGVTLRQLFYRLVSEQLIRNNETSYKGLSRATAGARRAGEFPALIDNAREISRRRSWNSPADAIDDAISRYRRDRTEGQKYNVYIGVEKAGMAAQLMQWFWPLGLPIIAVAGYASQTLADEVCDDIVDDGRPAVLLYAGDHDPIGHDILRDFVRRVGAFDDYLRVALNPDQVRRYGLPPLPGKSADSRSAAFIDRFGKLIQVELDALPPDVLELLYREGLKGWWDDDAYQRIMRRENADVSALRKRMKS
jgi:hypothetical protein